MEVFERLNDEEIIDEYFNNIELYKISAMNKYLRKIISNPYFVQKANTIDESQLNSLIDWYVNGGTIRLFSIFDKTKTLVLIDRHFYFLIYYFTIDTQMTNNYIRLIQSHPLIIKKDSYLPDNIHNISPNTYTDEDNLDYLSFMLSEIYGKKYFCPVSDNLKMPKNKCIYCKYFEKKASINELNMSQNFISYIIDHIEHYPNDKKLILDIFTNPKYSPNNIYACSDFGNLLFKTNIVDECVLLKPNYVCDAYCSNYTANLCVEQDLCHKKFYDLMIRSFQKNNIVINNVNLIKACIKNKKMTLEKYYFLTVNDKNNYFDKLLFENELYNYVESYWLKKRFCDDFAELFFICMQVIISAGKIETLQVDIGKFFHVGSKNKSIKSNLTICYDIYCRMAGINPKRLSSKFSLNTIIEDLNKGKYEMSDNLFLNVMNHIKWNLNKINSVREIYKNYKPSMEVIDIIDGHYNWGISFILKNIKKREKKQYNLKITNKTYTINRKMLKNKTFQEIVDMNSEFIVAEKYIISNDYLSKLLNIGVGILIDLKIFENELNK